VTAWDRTALAQRTDQKVRVLQETLHRTAKADPKRTFGVLNDKVTLWEVLWLAWYRVRRNRGAPGSMVGQLRPSRRTGRSGFCGRSTRSCADHIAAQRVIELYVLAEATNRNNYAAGYAGQIPCVRQACAPKSNYADAQHGFTRWQPQHAACRVVLSAAPRGHEKPQRDSPRRCRNK